MRHWAVIDLVKAMSMRVDGKTWVEIGKYFGSSASAIMNAVDRIQKSMGR